MADTLRLPVLPLARAAWRTMSSDWRPLAVLTAVLTALSTILLVLPWPNSCGAVLGERLGTVLVIELPRQVAGAENTVPSDALARSICLASVRLPPAVVSFLLAVLFTVAWQRRVLLPNERQSVWTIYGWDWRKTKVAVAALLALVPLGALAVAAAIAFARGYLPNPFDAVFGPWAMLAAILTGGRFALVFPALASDRGGHPGRAWRWLRGNYARLVAVMVLAPLPFLAVRYGCQQIDSETLAIPARVAASAFGYLALAAGASATALAYHDIREARYEQAAAATAQPGELRLRAGHTA